MIHLGVFNTAGATYFWNCYAGQVSEAFSTDCSVITDPRVKEECKRLELSELDLEFAKQKINYHTTSDILPRDAQGRLPAFDKAYPFPELVAHHRLLI